MRDAGQISTKYIFITGGVVSGLGKGISAASLGRLLKQRGLTVSAKKMDPYINMNPGMMSPFQHGEVFVTDDGGETDLDLGHYERFIDENLTKKSSLTSGKVYAAVLENERAGAYSGGTVQVIPHITDEIKKIICACDDVCGQPDILIVEIGGTIGDIECQPFLEAIRQISLEKGLENCLFIHVTLVPYLKSSKEHKTKPTQRSVKDLMAMGIAPNIIIARADEDFDVDIAQKISQFCNVAPDCVIENITANSLYEVPLILHEKGLDAVVCRQLSLDVGPPDLTEWKIMVDKINARNKTIKIAIVGKYVQLSDAYLSLIESLNHAGFEHAAVIDIIWVDSEELSEGNTSQFLGDAAGIVVPGGFGERGFEGKISAARFARENNVAFLGIGLGMQAAVVDFARNACGFAGANSTEFNKNTEYPVIVAAFDGDMRLGASTCKFVENSLIHSLYGDTTATERHRHRHKINNKFKEIFEQNGMIFSGHSPDKSLVEVIELPANKFFTATLFHPEFKSRPNRPHPLFLGFLAASIN